MVNFTELNVQEKKKEQEKANLTSIDTKIDQILKYQKSVRRIAIFRGFVSFVFFLVFIVFPIVGGFYFFKYIQNSGMLDNISGQYADFYQTFEEFKSTTSQVGDLKDLLK